jgi:hypothetical protein
MGGEDPERELRVLMFDWIEDHWDRIKAQHPGELDCIACPFGVLAHCFLLQHRTMKRGGYLPVEDQWLLNK